MFALQSHATDKIGCVLVKLGEKRFAGNGLGLLAARFGVFGIRPVACGREMRCAPVLFGRVGAVRRPLPMADPILAISCSAFEKVQPVVVRMSDGPGRTCVPRSRRGGFPAVRNSAIGAQPGLRTCAGGRRELSGGCWRPKRRAPMPRLVRSKTGRCKRHM